MKFDSFPLKQTLSIGASSASSISGSACEPLRFSEVLEDPAAALKQLADHRFAYPPVGGSEDFRTAIAATYKDVTADQLLVCNGADEALMLTFMSLLMPSDNLVVYRPSYPPFVAIPRALGCQVHEYSAEFKSGWRLDLFRLAEQLSTLQRVRMIVVSSPANPTGIVLGRDLLEQLAELAERFGALVLVDEAYRGIWLDHAATPPAAADVSSRYVSIGSMSKSLSLPGLRVGWVACRDAATLAQLRRGHCYVGSYLHPLAELVGSCALNRADAIYDRNTAIAAMNLRRLAHSTLGDHLEWCDPQGGSVMLARVKDSNAPEFTRVAEERHGVHILPADHFGAASDFVRLGFGTLSFADALKRFDESVK